METVVASAGDKHASRRHVVAAYLLVVLVVILAGCTNTTVDADSARITLRENRLADSLRIYRDSLRLLDSLRFADSTRYADSLRFAETIRRLDSLRQAKALHQLDSLRRADSVRYADSLRHCPDRAHLAGLILFPYNQGARETAPLVIDSLSRLEITFDQGTNTPNNIRLRLMARIDEQMMNNGIWDAPSWIYLNVSLQPGQSAEFLADPALYPDRNGLGVLYRTDQGGDQPLWMATEGIENKGRFKIDEVNSVQRVIRAHLTANFKWPASLSIVKIEFHFSY